MKKLFLVVLIVFFYSCSDTIKKPANLLPEDKMRDILINIHIAEGKVALLSMQEDSSKILYKNLTEKIFKKYKTDSLTFKKSYEYYSTFEGEKMEKIYTLVVDSLNMKEARKIVD